FTIAAKNFWEVKNSWDLAQIPKPFTRALVVIARPIYVADDADDQELEVKRTELQHALDEINQRGEDWRGKKKNPPPGLLNCATLRKNKNRENTPRAHHLLFAPFTL